MRGKTAGSGSLYGEFQLAVDVVSKILVISILTCQAVIVLLEMVVALEYTGLWCAVSEIQSIRIHYPLTRLHVKKPSVVTPRAQDCATSQGDTISPKANGEDTISGLPDWHKRGFTTTSVGQILVPGFTYVSVPLPGRDGKEIPSIQASLDRC